MGLTALRLVEGDWTSERVASRSDEMGVAATS